MFWLVVAGEVCLRVCGWVVFVMANVCMWLVGGGGWLCLGGLLMVLIVWGVFTCSLEVCVIRC